MENAQPGQKAKKSAKGYNYDNLRVKVDMTFKMVRDLEVSFISRPTTVIFFQFMATSNDFL